MKLTSLHLVLLCTFSVLQADFAVAQFREQDYVTRHLREDREWARRTSLSAEIVRDLRLMADVPDDSDTLIDYLDAHSLRSRNQVLLVTTSGNGHCLDLYVFARRRINYRLIWSATEMPSGAGYCRASPHNPEAYVSAGRIVAKIPVYDYQRGRPRATDFHSYVWNGQTYRYADVRMVRENRRRSAS